MNALELTVSLLLTLVQGIAAHYTPSSLAMLQNQEYVEFPAGLCTGSAETLLGQFDGSEYIGLICTQPTRSYMVLQQLIGYTPSKKAILKAVDIQPLPPLQPGERSINRGCVSQAQASSAIVAIVRDNGNPTYDVVQAWQANLPKKSFEEVSPQSVVCKSPW